MKNQNKLRKIIVKSDIVESLKVFLILNIDTFSEKQIDWLIKYLRK